MAEDRTDRHRIRGVAANVQRAAVVGRRNMTGAELSLWQELKGRKLDGYKFRRQHPLGRYIADFCCVELRLIIEVDGQTHEARHDLVRDAALAAYGYTTVRVTNREMWANLATVVDQIRKACHSAETARHVGL